MPEIVIPYKPRDLQNFLHKEIDNETDTQEYLVDARNLWENGTTNPINIGCYDILGYHMVGQYQYKTLLSPKTRVGPDEYNIERGPTLANMGPLGPGRAREVCEVFATSH